MSSNIILTLNLEEDSILLNEGILNALDWPRQIQLLINPETKQLVLRACSVGAAQAVVIEAEKTLNFVNNSCHRSAVLEQLRKRGIEARTQTRVKAIDGNRVLCETPEGEIALEADSIVNALGRAPLQEEAAAFGLAAPVFYPIGDCLAAKNVYEANRLGFNVAMDIGK